MSERKAFLIRVDPALLETLQRWADDELRSLNAHIEYLLRDAARRAGRKVKARTAAAPPAKEEG